MLLERGADPNLADSAGCTPLMHAAGVGNLAAARLLVAGLAYKREAGLFRVEVS